MTTRLTRKEQQARTRALLVESATRVLAEKGLHRASIDDITADAGFTKGAFYANFASKEELFLEMLDQHFAERLAAVTRLTAGGTDFADAAARAGDDFTQAVRGDEAWRKLFLEFSSHALRHDGFRHEFAARSDALRAEIAAIYQRRAAEMGLTSSFPPALIARIVYAMAHGAAVDQLMHDDSPDDLLGTMLRITFAGLVASGTPPDAAGR